ncbi:hypothetical protein CesoFtcFv8_019486 [Champsocephalus esox]|uniref:RGS domain-containing protein n=1 Tax=Champsocephalus esox TaxID=159716 RepID=A0AAN8BDB8_9TELE|nr:hypothetical protein CesoFtcFv8_019486 [Champsocephalus esox]
MASFGVPPVSLRHGVRLVAQAASTVEQVLLAVGEQVNLDSKTRDLSLQLLQAPSHASLSLAQKRIFSLLDLDCYPRFLQSDIYLSLLREAD